MPVIPSEEVHIPYAPPMQWLQFILAGSVVGFTVGLTGMGGGVLMTPILVLLFKVDPMAAVGSDLLVSFCMKPVGAFVHHKAGTIRWEIMKWLVPFSVPAGFAGAFILDSFDKGPDFADQLKLGIGAALLLAVAGMVAGIFVGRGPGKQPLGPSEKLTVRPLPTALIGIFGGLVVGMTSVGSGSLIIVLLMLVYPRLRARDLVGSDLIQAIPLVGAATLGHIVAGNVQFDLAGWLLIGAIPGIYVGAKFSTEIPNAVLRWVLAVLLLGSGLKLWGLPVPLVILASVALGVAGMEITARRSKREAAQRYLHATRAVRRTSPVN
jgi:uncharacterized membrane protein YfcA